MAENVDIATRIRRDYLSYRLNSRELVDLSQEIANPREVGPKLEIYRRDSHDEPGSVTPEELRKAHQELGLEAEFRALREDQVWSAYDRALYRRMSHPELDATPYQNVPDLPGDHQLYELLVKKFDSWDRDHDTHLTARELDRAMADGGSTPEEDAALVLLRSRLKSLGSCNPYDGEGFTLADLEIFAHQGIPQAGLSTQKINQDFLELVEKGKNLKEPGPLLEENFDPTQVNQNRLGSCVLLSTVADEDPQHLKSMFSQAADNLVVVNFKNGENEVVAEPTRAERLYHAFTNDGGRWPALLEIAVGQYLARKLRPEDGSIRTAADGIPVEEAYDLTTGQPAEKICLDELTVNEARQAVLALQSRPGPKICGSRPEVPPEIDISELEYLHTGIENGHCYGRLKYDPATDLVQIRNPWNRKLWVHSQEAAEKKPGGTFTMPFPQFYASYRWVACQPPPPLVSQT